MPEARAIARLDLLPIIIAVELAEDCVSVHARRLSQPFGSQHRAYVRGHAQSRNFSAIANFAAGSIDPEREISGIGKLLKKDRP